MFVFPGVRGEPVKPRMGVWSEIPFEEYLRWNAISNSSMGAAVRQISPLQISMGHYYQQTPVEETRAILIGKVAHAERFEFRTAAKNFIVMPDFRVWKELDDGSLIEDPCRNDDGKTISKAPANTKDYRSRVDGFKAKHIGKSFITKDDHERVLGMLYALDQDERALRYFKNNGPATDYELSIAWTDKETGLPCKARIDCAQHADRLVIDLKTVEDLSRFPRSIVEYGYHRQAAWYARAMTQITGYEYRPAIVAVEKNRPFQVAAASVSCAAMLAGEMQFRAVLNEIANAKRTGAWECPKPPDEWEIPSWAIPTVAIDDAKLLEAGMR